MQMLAYYQMNLRDHILDHSHLAEALKDKLNKHVEIVAPKKEKDGNKEGGDGGKKTIPHVRLNHQTHVHLDLLRTPMLVLSCKN